MHYAGGWGMELVGQRRGVYIGHRRGEQRDGEGKEGDGMRGRRRRCQDKLNLETTAT